MPARLLVVQDHGDVLPYWRSFASTAILHVDKHDDLELPERDFACALSAGRPADIRNNNFLLAAAFCGVTQRVLWVHPSFSCAHCDYGPLSSVGRHECEIGRTHDGSFMVRQLNSGLQSRALPCGAKEQSEVASGTASLSLSQRYDLTFTDIATFRSLPESAGWGSSSGSTEPWLLDIDLDYFVDDKQSPKMLGMPDRLFDKRLSQRFNVSELKRIQRWARGQGADLALLAMYDLYIARQPVPIIDKVQARRIAKLEDALRRHVAAPPAGITVVRSNVGGYTPIEATSRLEEAVLSMLRSVYPSLRGVQAEYRGDNTLNRSSTEILGRWLTAARLRG